MDDLLSSTIAREKSEIKNWDNVLEKWISGTTEYNNLEISQLPTLQKKNSTPTKNNSAPTKNNSTPTKNNSKDLLDLLLQQIEEEKRQEKDFENMLL